MQKEDKKPVVQPPALPAAQPIAQPATQPARTKKGKPFAITSIVIAAIGIIPLIVYLFCCLDFWERKSRLHYSLYSGLFTKTPDSSLVLAMGFIGFLLHGIGLGCGITGLSLRSKTTGIIGMIANLVIIGAILLFGFVTML